MKPNKKLLVVAYMFPPLGGVCMAGSQRVVKFCRYLPEYGWDPIVLTAREDSYEDYAELDPSLMSRISPDMIVERTRVLRWVERLLKLKNRFSKNNNIADASSQPSSPEAGASADPMERSDWQKIKDAISDLWTIPDTQVGWMLPAVTRGIRLTRKHKIKAILATGKPWTGLVVGAAVSRITRTPFFADFRDPWITNPYRQQPSAFKHWAETKLEGFVVRSADVVMANTPHLRTEFGNRFPSVSPAKFATFLNGFDAADANGQVKTASQPKVWTLLHIGFLYGLRDPRDFLLAVREALSQQLVSAEKLRVRFIGNVDLPYNLSELVDELGLSDMVVIDGQVGFDEVQAAAANADLLLLLQPGTTTQIPSKLFEYIAHRKPILCVSPSDGATAKIVADEKLGWVADPEDRQQITRVLGDASQQLQAGRCDAVMKRVDISKFDVRMVTRKLADHLDAVVSVADSGAFDGG